MKTRGDEKGGAALEYILVSTFAAALCMVALGFIGKAVEEKLVALGAKLGATVTPDAFDWLGSDDP